jgi:hypothetical protein
MNTILSSAKKMKPADEARSNRTFSMEAPFIVAMVLSIIIDHFPLGHKGACLKKDNERRKTKRNEILRLSATRSLVMKK